MDDNSFPKQIWSFVLCGRKFANSGPPGYALAHLADHKVYKNRGAQEFETTAEGPWSTLHGLFTCATNTAYIAEGYIRPTDFAGPLRNLIQRKAVQLYGDFCNLLPPHLTLSSNLDPAWSVNAFNWAPVVTAATPVETFLTHRNQVMAELLLARTPV